jgi:hypothetical protein
LHVGSYSGWPGRLAMMLAALSPMLFVVTGWMMYLLVHEKIMVNRFNCPADFYYLNQPIKTELAHNNTCLP